MFSKVRGCTLINKSTLERGCKNCLGLNRDVFGISEKKIFRLTRKCLAFTSQLYCKMGF